MNRKQRINNLLLNHLKEFSIEILDNSHLHINHNNFDGTGETHIKIILEKRKEVKFDRLNLDEVSKTNIKAHSQGFFGRDEEMKLLDNLLEKKTRLINI